jgi:hypothetical protein
MKRHLLCPYCFEVLASGAATAPASCPHRDCREKLPALYGETDVFTIALIGAKESGKSHTIAVLIDELKHRIGKKFGGTFSEADDRTAARYHNDFYKPLYLDKTTIGATHSGRPSQSAVRTPLIYNFKQDVWSLAGAKGSRTCTFVIYDTAGEDLESEDSFSSPELRCISNCDAIIFLLDPRQRPEPDSDAASRDKRPRDILRRTTNRMRQVRGVGPNQKIDIPVAIAFSKIDGEVAADFDDNTRVKTLSRHHGFFDVDAAERVSDNVRSHVAAWQGADFDEFVSKYYASYSYFGFTALGAPPGPGGRVARPTPRRVEDPFLWILYKLEIIGRVRAQHAGRWRRGAWAAVLVVAMVAAAWAGRHSRFKQQCAEDPGLPGCLSEVSCQSSDSLSTDARCVCLRILASGDEHLSLGQRMERLAPYRSACAASPGRVAREPLLEGLMTNLDLAETVVNPAAFCPTRVRAASKAGLRPGQASPLPDWYPAATDGEKALMQWTANAAVGQTTEPLADVREALRDELGTLTQLKPLLEGAVQAQPCLTAWSAARRGSAWKSVKEPCQRLDERFPSELYESLRADASCVGASIPDLAGHATPAQASAGCPDRGLERLLFPAPARDVLTAANSAVLAPAKEFGARLAEARRLQPQDPHTDLVELLSPWSQDAERVKLATGLDVARLQMMTSLLESEGLCLDDKRGKRAGRPDGRWPRLSMARARDAACAVMGISPSALPGDPWSEPVVLAPFPQVAGDGGVAETTATAVERARLARQLLAQRTVRKSQDAATALCATRAFLTAYRADGVVSPNEILGRIELLVRDPASTFAPAARELRCHLQAHVGGEGALAQIESDVSWLLLRAGTDESARERAERCMRHTILFTYAREDRDTRDSLTRAFKHEFNSTFTQPDLEFMQPDFKLLRRLLPDADGNGDGGTDGAGGEEIDPAGALDARFGSEPYLQDFVREMKDLLEKQRLERSRRIGEASQR